MREGRRRNYRKREQFPAGPIFALILLLGFAWVASPAFRAITLIVLILAVAGGAGFFIFLYIKKKQRAEDDWIAGLTKNRPPPMTTQTAHDSFNATFTNPAAPQPVPQKRYTTKRSVLSAAEIQFHEVLLKAVPEAPIFPKVRVADIIEATERYSGDFLKISQKHFDWVLCHPVSYEPLIAIELDDSSHSWSSRQQKNDAVKNEAASEAGIRLMRFPWQKEYQAESIRNLIGTVLDQIADKKQTPN